MGIAAIKKAFPNVKIAVHKDEAAELSSAPGRMNCDILSMFGMDFLIQALSLLPCADILLENSINLSILSDDEDLKKELLKWKVIHTPGHSPGSVCYYNEIAQLLISGDTLFDYGGYGRTDMTGGDELLIQKSLNMLGKTIKKGTKVYPGHDSFGFSF
jgi:glyoxylase-like metal-dependent hydrolase (beta-lactamase superfamily II)